MNVNNDCNYAYHDDDDDDDQEADRNQNRIHPMVEQTIVEGMKRRHSRHSFCLTGDFLMHCQDVHVVLKYVDVTPMITRLVFVQTTFSSQSMDLFATYLAIQKRIKKLIFSSVLLVDDLASRFFAAIARNRSIHELVFHDCCFDIDAAIGRDMAMTLPHNPGLQSLNLTGNGSTETGLYQLTNALRHITELNLSDCELNCGKAMVLFRGLANNSSLRALDLSNNDIRAPSLRLIAQHINKNEGHGLQSLSLGSNKRLFDDAVKETSELARSLCLNHTLKRLLLERCGLVGETASVLFQALETNQTLEELNVQINSGIGILGYECMTRSITQFRGLKCLAFDALHPQLDQPLLTALRENWSLTRLQPHYGLDPNVQKQVNDITRRNQLCQMVVSSSVCSDRIQRGLAAICLRKLTQHVDGSTAIFAALRSTLPLQ